jgi:hypothetical protein
LCSGPCFSPASRLNYSRGGGKCEPQLPAVGYADIARRAQACSFSSFFLLDWAIVSMSLLRLKPPIFPPQFPTPASSREAPRFKRYDDKINHRNVKGETQLHRAAAKGDCELMQTLLDHGAYADISDFAGWTPLHEAVAEGFYTAGQLLIT